MVPVVRPTVKAAISSISRIDPTGHGFSELFFDNSSLNPAA